MSLAALSLTALVVALVVSCISQINIGVLALVLAWIVGVYAGGMKVEQVLAGFPVPLFLTLVGITLLFAQAQGNGTLDRLAQRAVRLCRGRAGMIPIIFFVLTAAMSAAGPGNIAATALMAPLGMAAAGRYGIPPFLMAIMIANGASAGSVSPIAPTGIIVNGLVETIGLPDVRWTIFANNLLAHAAVAFTGYLVFGGLTLLRDTTTATAAADDAPAAIGWPHWLTIAIIAALIAGAIVFNINVGLAALLGALLLTLARAASDTAAIKTMPWSAIVMVTGVTVLVSLLEKTGGMTLFTEFLGHLSTTSTVTAVTAFFTGLVSIYSSTTGVVLPALLPTVPGIVEHVPNASAMSIVSSMVVGGHLVDVSPLSTLGALCLAAAPQGTDTRRLFNQLLAWGVSMTVVAAAVCWIFFGVL